MLAKKVIESDFVIIKERQQFLLKHYERLKEIKQSDSKKSPVPSNPQKAKPYSEINRKLEIRKNNKALLDKILHINHRKPETPPKKSETLKNIKSLNFPYRKKEAKRILTENEQIAKRIKTQKALIPKKKFDKDFEIYKKYKLQLSKSRLLKFQESNLPSLGVLEKKQRTLTPTIESFNFDSERMRSYTPHLKKYEESKENFSRLAVEDDSSYEEDFV